MRFQFASRTAQRVTINWMRGRRSLNWGSIERARREKEQNRRRRKWKKLKLYQTQKKNLNTFSKVFFFGRSWCRRCFFAIAYVAVLAFSSTSSEKFSIVFFEQWTVESHKMRSSFIFYSSDGAFLAGFFQNQPIEWFTMTALKGTRPSLKVLSEKHFSKDKSRAMNWKQL